MSALTAGFDRWATSYDITPNPLIALEARLLAPRLGNVSGLRVLDLGTGTGRWLQWLRAQGAQAFGIDRSLAMLRAGRSASVAQADLTVLPFPDKFADLAVCSFTLSYVADLTAALREVARVTRRIVVSDLHPEAHAAGWKRGSVHHTLASFPYGLPDLEAILGPAEWTLTAAFGEPERAIFEAAGKDFHAVANINALYAACWSLP